MNMTQEDKELALRIAREVYGVASDVDGVELPESVEIAHLYHIAKLEQAGNGFDGYAAAQGYKDFEKNEFGNYKNPNINALHCFYQAGAASQSAKIAELTEEVERLKAEQQGFMTASQMEIELTKQLQSAQLAIKVKDGAMQAASVLLLCGKKDQLPGRCDKAQAIIRKALDTPIDTSAADELQSRHDHWKAEAMMLAGKVIEWERRSESCESKLGQLEANEKVDELLARVKELEEDLLGARRNFLFVQEASREKTEQLTAAHKALEEAREAMRRYRRKDIRCENSIATIDALLGKEGKGAEE